MLRIPLPFTDTFLLLTPPWSDVQGPLRIVVLLLLLLVPVLVYWLYRYEMHLVRRTTALTLLTLRLVVLFGLLFLVFLKPILAHSTNEVLPGRVLIAVDCSDSMDVADPQRPPLPKLRLAKALHLAGDICPDARLESWMRSYESRTELVWVADNEYPDNAERRQQLQAERRQQHHQVFQRIDALTRLQVAHKVLADDGGQLLKAIEARHKVELLGFAQETWDVPRDQFDDLFTRRTGAVSPRKGEKKEGVQKTPGAEKTPGANAPPLPGAQTQSTDLRLPLVRALERSGPDQGKILGVVLLTDGQHNARESPVAKAIEMGEHKLPIFPVALGDRLAPPDIALVSVTSPPSVFKDVDLPITARFKVSGLPSPQDLVAELRVPGKVEPEKQVIHHDGTDKYYTLSFKPRMEQVGTQTLTLSIKPVPGEIRTDNNSRPVVVNVADEKAKVLLVDGEARWEYHYLASALARDRVMKVQSVVFAQPRVGRVSEEELKKMGNPALTLPTEPDALAGFDCIVLGDVPPDRLPPAERIRLEKYVADRGGTLVILAGKRYMPLAYHKDKAELGPQGDPLLNLLPIEGQRVVHPIHGFPVTLTHEGKLASFLQMEPSPDESTRRWAELPRHFWGVVGFAKPGATVLAYYPDEDLAAAKLDPASKEKDQALIVRQNYGFGRVLFVGLDSTWRWRYKVGDTYHHRFWSQLIHWAASDKPLVAGNEYVRFGTREPVYKKNQEVDLVVRLADEVTQLRPEALAGARILRVDDAKATDHAVAVAPLTRKEAQPRVLEGKIRDLPPGQYAIELAIPELADKLHGPTGSDGQPGKLRATFSVAPEDNEEMIELATNWPLLEELAAKSGGKVFTPDNTVELAALLNTQAVTRELREENRLWQDWTTLIVFLFLLTAEWVGRKLAGLP